MEEEEEEKKPEEHEEHEDFSDLKEIVSKYIESGKKPEEIEEAIKECFRPKFKDEKEEAEHIFGMKF